MEGKTASISRCANRGEEVDEKQVLLRESWRQPTLAFPPITSPTIVVEGGGRLTGGTTVLYILKIRIHNFQNRGIGLNSGLILLQFLFLYSSFGNETKSLNNNFA